jgi:hypothetical protein
MYCELLCNQLYTKLQKWLKFCNNVKGPHLEVKVELRGIWVAYWVNAESIMTAEPAQRKLRTHNAAIMTAKSGLSGRLIVNANFLGEKYYFFNFGDISQFLPRFYLLMVWW